MATKASEKVSRCYLSLVGFLCLRFSEPVQASAYLNEQCRMPAGVPHPVFRQERSRPMNAQRLVYIGRSELAWNFVSANGLSNSPNGISLHIADDCTRFGLRQVCDATGFRYRVCSGRFRRWMRPLGHALQIVRNSKPNERGGGCASHNCSPFELR
jgi:hypothetical protein